MALRAVIFDLGGTLLHYHDPQENDPQRPFRRVTQEGLRSMLARLAELGIRLPASDKAIETINSYIAQAYQAGVREMLGDTIEAPIRNALVELGIQLSEDQWSDARQDFYRTIDETVTPRLGVVDTLRNLREAGYQLSLISNTWWAADLHDRHLAEQGLLEFLPLRIYSCNMPFAKPHPSIFHRVLDELSISPKQAVYVGDRSDVDIAGAQNVGMAGILIRSPYIVTELDSVVPDAIIDELPELPNVLQRLDARSK